MDCEGSEIYQVSNHFRDDIISDYQEHLYTSVFKQYQNVERFIRQAEDNILSEDGDAEDCEYISDGCYWTITKYRLKNNIEYEDLFTLTLVNHEDCLEIVFNLNMEKEFSYIEKKLYNEWLQLSGVFSKTRLEIEYPFSKADILGINCSPYQHRKRYYVFCGGSGVAISRDFWGRICLTNLFSNPEIYGYNFFVPYYLEKSYSCNDRVFQNLSNLISKSSDEDVDKLIDMLRRLPEESFEEYDMRIEKMEKNFLDKESFG